MEYSVLDNLFDCIAVINDRAEIVFANQAFIRFCEISYRNILREKSLKRVINFESDLFSSNSSLHDIAATTQYTECLVSLPNKGTRRVQYFLQPLPDHLWMFTFRDITLEERLNVKFRAELDAKENAIRTLDRNLRENKILLRLSESLNVAEKGPASLNVCLSEIEKSMDFHDSTVCLSNAKGELEVLSVRRSGSSSNRPVDKSRDAKCLQWLNQIKDPRTLRDGTVLPLLKDWHILSPNAPGALVFPLTIDDRCAWAVFGLSHSGSSDSGAKSPLLKALMSSLAMVIEGCVLLERSTRDGLTSLHNVSYFKSVVEREIHRVRRSSTSLGVCLFDVDHFKKFNDTHGHQIGDQVLAHVSKLILNTIRKSDLAARIGGEEFAILLPDADLAGAEAAANKVCKAIANAPIETAKGVLSVTVSGGCSTFPGTAQDYSALLEIADRGLYQAKHEGRNRVCVANVASSGKKERKAA